MSESTQIPDSQLAELVAYLANEKECNWTRMISERDAADAILMKMAELGLVEHHEHPLGGNIWIIGGQLFGRTDDIPSKFSKYTIATK